MKYLKIADEFSRTPGLRYEYQTPGTSGEKFRDNLLLPTLKECNTSGSHLTLDLDDVEGYSSSFLEEVFGGVVRKLDLMELQVLKNLYIKSNSESRKNKINRYMLDEMKRTKKYATVNFL